MSEIITKMGGFIINGKFVTRSGLAGMLDELTTQLKGAEDYIKMMFKTLEMTKLERDSKVKELQTKLKEIKLIHKDCASDYENAEHRANNYRLELKTAMADTEDWKSIARAHHDQVEKLEKIIEVQGECVEFYASEVSRNKICSNDNDWVKYGGRKASACIKQVNGLRGEL